MRLLNAAASKSFPLGKWRYRVALATLALRVTASTVTALGDLAVATSATQTQLTRIGDGYTVALACLLLPAGAVGDRYGRRGALLTGVMVFALGSATPAILHIHWRASRRQRRPAFGAAFVMPATLSLLTFAYPKEDRMKAVGM